MLSEDSGCHDVHVTSDEGQVEISETNGNCGRSTNVY